MLQAIFTLSISTLKKKLVFSEQSIVLFNCKKTKKNKKK